MERIQSCDWAIQTFEEYAVEEINAKSIMKAPAIETAAEIDFIINGEDEKAAADAISAYFITNN